MGISVLRETRPARPPCSLLEGTLSIVNGDPYSRKTSDRSKGRTTTTLGSSSLPLVCHSAQPPSNLDGRSGSLRSGVG